MSIVLSNIRLRVLVCGAPTLTHAITLTHFETVSSEGDDDGLMPIGAEGNDGRAAIEAISVRMAQLLCLTECTIEASRDFLTEFILALLNPATSAFAPRKIYLLFSTDREATPPHFGYRFLTFENGLPTRGPGGGTVWVEESP